MTARTNGDMAINEARAMRLVLAALREIEDGDTDTAIASAQAVFAEVDTDDLQDIARGLVDLLVSEFCRTEKRYRSSIVRVEKSIAFLLDWSQGKINPNTKGENDK
jgi:hypothetical protein